MRRLAALTIVLAVLVPAGVAHAAPAPGLNVAGLADQNVDEGLATGAKYLRFFAHWSGLEPTSGTIDSATLAAYGNVAARVKAGGATPIFVVTGAPQWSHPLSADGRYRPDSPAAFASFMSRFAGASQIKGKGVVYELWNEMDEADFWLPTPDPAHYAAMVKLAYPAIKQADPSATVLLGPTTGNNYGWLDSLYDNGVQGSFDGVAVHTDTACLADGPENFYRDNGRLARYAFLGYREVAATLAARGDSAKKIWMTEFGWSSTTTTCARGMWAGKKPAGVTEAKQAEHMAKAWYCLSQDDSVAVAAWFTLYDDPTAPNEELRHYGLLRGPGAAAKPAYKAFSDYARSGATASGPCGDFDPPVLRLLAPNEGRRFDGTLLIRAAATDGTGVGLGRITFRLDDNPAEIKNFTGTALKPDVAVQLDWQGAKKLANGPHKLAVESVDLNGNQSVATVGLLKVDPSQLLSTDPTTTRVYSVRCKGKRCTVRGKVVGPDGISVDGKVQVEWQAKRKGAFKTIHKGLKSAGKSFTVSQKLKYKGAWRVRVTYLGKPPLKTSVAPLAALHVK